MMRALTRASASAALFRCATRSAGVPHEGAHRSMIFVSIQVAKASFSQMSSHHAAVTRSPNHWCANSCAATSAYSRRRFTPSCSGRASTSSSRKVTSPTFSIAPNWTVKGMASTSSFSYG